jgi:hypothetical protein
MSQTTWGDPNLTSAGYPPKQETGKIEIPPKGCICPPGANVLCEAWDCPRKNYSQLKSTLG